MAAFVLGLVYWLWGTVPRPGHALSRLEARTGCPRPLPPRVVAPAELTDRQRCVLVWSAYRFPVYGGIPAETGRIDSAVIVTRRERADRSALVHRWKWDVTLWLAPSAGTRRIWRVSVDQHSGWMDLHEPDVLELARMRKRAGIAAEKDEPGS